MPDSCRQKSKRESNYWLKLCSCGVDDQLQFWRYRSSFKWAHVWASCVTRRDLAEDGFCENSENSENLTSHFFQQGKAAYEIEEYLKEFSRAWIPIRRHRITRPLGGQLDRECRQGPKDHEWVDHQTWRLACHTTKRGDRMVLIRKLPSGEITATRNGLSFDDL